MIKRAMSALEIKRVHQLFQIVSHIEHTNLTIKEYAGRLGVAVKALRRWRCYFIPDSSEAKPEWIEITGPLDFLPSYATKGAANIDKTFQKWLDLCNEIEIGSIDDSNNSN